MCFLKKLFNNKQNIEEMTSDELDKYIQSLDQKISDQSIANSLSVLSEDSQNHLDKTRFLRERALLARQKIIDESKMF